MYDRKKFRSAQNVTDVSFFCSDIKRRFNSIRDQVKEGDIEICKIYTDLNVADPLTNNLSHKRDMNKPHGCWIHYNHMVM